MAAAIRPVAAWRLGGVTEWDPGAGRIPRTQQWNANVQREVMKNLTVDVGYVGTTRSSNLLAPAIWRNKNQLDPKYLSFGSDLQFRFCARTPTRNASGCLACRIRPSLAVSSGRRSCPFPHLARNGIGLTTFNAPLGKSRYRLAADCGESAGPPTV